VTGHDPDTEPQVFDAFCPLRNVTPDYPPTLLLHGDQDTDVPYQQSVLMAEALEQHGVEHRLITAANGGHGFDGANGGLQDPANARRFAQVLEFLQRHTL
jgi:dipeptidyl aminopeptidase/acylaminoacyl peptidase